MAKEVYRNRKGQFVSRRCLWNGPPTPQHIIDAYWRDAMERGRKAMIAQLTARNQLLDLVRVR